MATHLSYYAYDEAAPLTCPGCGWTGPGAKADKNHYAQLFDLSCPQCDRMLVIVAYLTIDETRAEAERGNPRAIAALQHVETIETVQALHEIERLRSTEQLPEIDGDSLAFLWDFEEDDNRDRTRDDVIWREDAVWEGTDRFFEIKELLREKYGPRFASLTPTDASELWLYGDEVRWVFKGGVPTT
jgi:hypothetical protein